MNFRDELLEAKKPNLSKEMKKIFDEMDKLLDLNNVKLKGAEADLIRPHKDTRERGKNGRPMKESVDFKAQLMAKLSEYKHINSFRTGKIGNMVNDGDVVIDGTLLDGSKVYNNIKFKGLDKAQTEILLKSLNKALPALNKKLDKWFNKS